MIKISFVSSEKKTLKSLSLLLLKAQMSVCVSVCLSVCVFVSSQFSIKPISIRSLSHVAVLVGLRAVGGYSGHCAVVALCCAVGFKKQHFQNRRIHGFRHLRSQSIRSGSHVAALVGPRAVRRYCSHCAVGALCCAVGLKKQYFQNRLIAIRRFQYPFSQSCCCIGESLCGRELYQSLCYFYIFMSSVPEQSRDERSESPILEA